MNQRSMREARRDRQRSKKIIIIGKWVGVVLFILGIGGLIAWRIMRPSVGEEIPIMVDSGKHVVEGTDPGPYNSNPPT